MTDVAQEPVAEEPTAEHNEWIEYLGDPDNPHGVDFLQSHTIPRTDPVWKRLGVKATKDLVWERDPLGPAVGHKGNRLLLSTEGLDQELVSVLTDKVPGYKRVNE